MENYPRQIKIEKNQKCSVCNELAEYEVILYDYYDFANETFYEQDYTCPFLCEKHMELNEQNAEGERRPRGRVDYPYTNKHLAQGYSKYIPLKDVYNEFFETNAENDATLQIDLNEVNDELIKFLAIHPEFMLQLHHRKFEELIASIFRNKGYEVTLTPPTRDGGKDIIALYKSPFGHQMFIIECKRYNKENKVGVELVRNLYGVKTAERCTQGILVTTSTFSKYAIDFVKPLKYELELKDFTDITNWCKEYGNKQ